MRFAGVLIAAVSLAAPASAGAKIVVQHSIAGIAPDMSRAQVTSKLGEPLKRKRSGKLTIWSFRDKLTVVFTAGHAGVTSVGTNSAKQRTAGGLGVGSTRRAVKRGLKGEHCNDLACTIGTFANDSIDTTFIFDGNRVSGVEVRRQVIDVNNQG